jgi:hypothetical protein
MGVIISVSLIYKRRMMMPKRNTKGAGPICHIVDQLAKNRIVYCRKLETAHVFYDALVGVTLPAGSNGIQTGGTLDGDYSKWRP